MAGHMSRSTCMLAEYNDSRSATFLSPASGAPMGIDEKPAASVDTADCGAEAISVCDGTKPEARVEAAAASIGTTNCGGGVIGVSDGAKPEVRVEVAKEFEREGSCDEAADSTGHCIDAALEPWNAEARSRPLTRASAQSATVFMAMIILYKREPFLQSLFYTGELRAVLLRKKANLSDTTKAEGADDCLENFDGHFRVISGAKRTAKGYF